MHTKGELNVNVNVCTFFFFTDAYALLKVNKFLLKSKIKNKPTKFIETNIYLNLSVKPTVMNGIRACFLCISTSDSVLHIPFAGQNHLFSFFLC